MVMDTPEQSWLEAVGEAWSEEEACSEKPSTCHNFQSLTPVNLTSYFPLFKSFSTLESDH